MDNFSRESTFLSQGSLDTIMDIVSETDLEMLLKTNISGVGDRLQEEDHFTVEPKQEILRMCPYENLSGSTQQNTALPVLPFVPASPLPSTDLRPYSFDMELPKTEGDRIKWEVGEDHFTVESKQEISHMNSYENLPDSTQQNTALPVLSLVSTSALPSMDNYPGPYSFDVELTKSEGDRTKWEYSNKLNKLFVVMGTKIPFKFKVNSTEPGLLIRVLPIFLAQDSFGEPVKRCPTHASKSEESNKDFLYVDHIIRCHHTAAVYHINPDSKRLSVVVPIEPPQPGCDAITVMYSFVCKNSCMLGMNRRSTALIFTLERQNGEVIGRKQVNIRICCCPRRDISKEEADDLNNTEIERLKMENLSSDKKNMIKKPLKRLSNELTRIRVPRNYLKILRDIILQNKTDLEDENISLENVNEHLH